MQIPILPSYAGNYFFSSSLVCCRKSLIVRRKNILVMLLLFMVYDVLDVGTHEGAVIFMLCMF